MHSFNLTLARPIFNQWLALLDRTLANHGATLHGRRQPHGATHTEVMSASLSFSYADDEKDLVQILAGYGFVRAEARQEMGGIANAVQRASGS